jgi:hypothetical protein
MRYIIGIYNYLTQFSSTGLVVRYSGTEMSTNLLKKREEEMIMKKKKKEKEDEVETPKQKQEMEAAEDKK